MEKEKRAAIFSMIIAILIWGGLWGVFEATVGYILHLLPFSIGWLVWYPVACFFMLNVYRKTQRTEAVFLVGILSACIKLLNLLLPGRIDKVLNPAVSIVFEALAMTAVIWGMNHFFTKKKRNPLSQALAILCMNTGWRVLYILYLLFLVPDWMREISAVSDAGAFITFLLVHNFFTSLVLFGGSVLAKNILRPIEAVEDKLSAFLSSFPHGADTAIKTAGAICMIGSSIALELLL